MEHLQRPSADGVCVGARALAPRICTFIPHPTPERKTFAVFWLFAKSEIVSTDALILKDFGVVVKTIAWSSKRPEACWKSCFGHQGAGAL